MTRVAVKRNGSVEIVPNDKGADATPSYVGWDPSGQLLIGEDAMHQAWVHPETTLFDFKWLLGKSYDEAVAEAKSRGLPYKIVNRSEKPVIQVVVVGDLMELTPEEVTSLLLSKIKRDAEGYLGVKIVDVVVTAPAYFRDAQRQAIRDAVALSGMNAARVISEPIAALISLGIDKENRGRDVNLLVIDAGGSSVDVAVIVLDGGVFEVLAVDQVRDLGGRQLSERVMTHVLDEWKRSTGDRKITQGLWGEVERAKSELAISRESTIRVNTEAAQGSTLSVTVSRDLFEQLNADAYAKLPSAIARVLAEARLDVGEIDEVVLIGGSSHMPKLHELIQECMKSDNLSSHGTAPIASGAAILGHVFGGGDDASSNMIIFDVVVMSFGVETAGGVMHKVIRRNSVIPNHKSIVLTTFHDNQTEVAVRVFTEERAMTRANRLLGSLKISGLAPAPHGYHKIDVSFRVNAENTVLHVVATERLSGLQDEKTISLIGGGYTSERIEWLYKDAETHLEDDAHELERVALCLKHHCADVLVAEDAAVVVPPQATHDEL